MNIMGCPLKCGEAILYLSEKTGIPYVEAKLPAIPMYYEYSLETARNVLGFVPKYDTKTMFDNESKSDRWSLYWHCPKQDEHRRERGRRDARPSILPALSAISGVRI